MPCVSHGCLWAQHPHPDPPCRGEVLYFGCCSLKKAQYFTGTLHPWLGGCVGSLPWDRTCCGMVSAGPQSRDGLHVLGSPTLWLTRALMPSCPLSHGLILPCSCPCSVPLALSQVIYHSCGCPASGQVLASVAQPLIPAALSPGRVLAPTLALQHPGYPSTAVLQLCPGSPQGNVPGGHGVFRKTGLGACWPCQENKNIRAGSHGVSVRGRHSINPLEQVLCSRHKEMSILFSLA